MQPCDEHEYVSLLVVRLPMSVLHCWSRDVHWPAAHCKPAPESPQDVPSSALRSAGHTGDVPEHVSSGSQTPVLARHTVPAPLNWHCCVQHSSLEKSHTLFVVNLHVVGLQHGLFAHPEVPPQSQSSPAST